MGCMSTKQQGRKNAPSSEKSFTPLDKKTEIKSVEDVVAKQSDFVVEHQDMKLFTDKYEMSTKELGKGAFGSVKKAILRDNGEERAVKIIDKLSLDKQERIRLKYEIDILKNLQHPNIVRLYEIFENKSSIFLVQELCDGCELFEEIISRKQISENEAALVIKQILQAISYCHNKQVAHRDLKPENILIDVKNKGFIKVIDFGTSHHFDKDNNTMTQMYGTPYYIAPEVLQERYTEKCDLWSIGVIMYIMLCGMPPFNGSDEQILAKVKKGHWEFRGRVWNDVSPEAKDLIQNLMIKDPEKRLDAKTALEHPWIQQKVQSKFNTRLAEKAINNLQKFKNESKLKQATLTFMTSHLATKKQMQELRNSFNQFDENGDGMIQRHEFLKAYRALYAGNKNATEEEIDERAMEIFTQADTDNNGELDFGEWCTATISSNELLNEDNMRAAFALFDKDGGGTIDASEVATILGHNISREEQVWQDVINEVDKNGDGQIDFEEFQIMLKKLADREVNLDGPPQV